MINLTQNTYNRQYSLKQQPNFSQVIPFKGNLATAATDAVTGGIKWIEHGGVLADFLFVDTIGMVLPRTYQAFNRNKEELGHPNYKSGFEELIREIFSGPSMFFIPMGLIALSGKLFGSASNIQHQTLDSLTASFKNHVAKDPHFENSRQLKDKFYTNVFQEAFEAHKKVELKSPVNINEEISKILKNIGLLETEKDKNKVALLNKELVEIVSDLNKAHGLHLNNSHEVSLKDTLTNNTFTKTIGTLVEDLHNYSKDIVEKVAETAKTSSKEKLSGVIENLHNIKSNGRKFNFFATVLATASFLYIIPIMYKRNKQFPGIDGLTKSADNQVLVTQQNKANVPIRQSNAINLGAFKKLEINTATNKPSEANSSQKKQVSFSGGGSKFFRYLDFNKQNAPHAILAFYTLGIMLGARLLQARNADERREVATRDFSGLSTIVFAIPILRNITSTISRKVTGFPISSKLSEGFAFITDHLRPKKGVQPMSFENINDIYSGVGKYKNGLVDFSENISKHGGNLHKIFDFLTDDSKKAFNEIAEKLGSKGEKINNGVFGFLTAPFKAGKADLLLPSSNEQIISLIKKAHSDEKLKPLLDKVTAELSKEGNHLVKFAEALKSLPEAVSIVAVSGFLGWFLPWFNINYTKKLYKNKNIQPEQKQVNVPDVNSSINQAITKFLQKK
ncbi:MAG: hypothetical protein WCK67_03045 [bacterium]